MKVLLMVEVPKVGHKGEIVEVSEGYAKNLLLRKKLAQIATPQIIEQYNAKKLKDLRIKEEKNKEIAILIGLIVKENFEFIVKTGKNGEVFSSVHSNDIRDKVIEFLHSHGGKTLQLDDVRCEAKPIKELGEHLIAVKIGKGEYGKDLKIKVSIIPEKS
jgi:large subunit ribosomal protein L9